MAEISAQMVKDLRETTGLPMMECKQALSENHGDFDKAKDWLRKKYKGKLSDRAARDTSEGRISVFVDPGGKFGGIIELQCETTPVAVNEKFVGLAQSFAEFVARQSNPSPDPEEVRGEPKLDAKFTEVFGLLREAMKLAKCRRISAEYVTAYVHHDGKSGVLLGLNKAPSNTAVGNDLAMHTTFAKPVAVDERGVSPEMIQKIRTEAREIALAEGKKPEIADKVSQGRVDSFLAESTLMNQLHARSDVYGKKKIREVLKDAGVDAVTDMIIMQVGR